jgi:polyhydroxyalkanoate synthesis regulator phasin
MEDKLMENVQVILELYKKGELNNDQAFDILYGMYRTAKYNPSNKSTDISSSYFSSFDVSNTSTTWNEPLSPEQK